MSDRFIADLQTMLARIAADGLMKRVRLIESPQARIRTQMSAALTTVQLDRALAAFGKVSRDLGVIK